MAMPERIYLDNAATSWPKPEAVYQAVERYQRQLGAPAGRSAYAEAAEVEAAIRTTRSQIAALIGAEDARTIAFAFNGTDALNQAIHGVLRDGDHVVTTVVEHNSVLRPLRALEEQRRITVSRVACDATGIVDPDDVRAATLLHKTRLVVVSHASNVTGALQPAAEIGNFARERGCLFLLDAAQSLGDVSLNARELQVDLLAAPGHKGLLGPLGTGVLYVRSGVEPHLRSFRQGGTGSRSEEDRQPELLPDKYESGNLNVPGILGLGAGIDYLRQRGIDAVRAHAQQLTQQLLEGLSTMPGVTVFGPRDAAKQVGLVSVNLEGIDPQVAAGMLDVGYSIQTRAGLHCAPLMHKALGTLGTGGTLRFSIGPFNTEEHIDAALTALREISAAAPAL
jgi:cysteine desulfurase family protein